MRGISKFAALLIAALVPGAACTELPAIQEGSCGNGLVEPELGEDCDTFPNGACLPAGDRNQCRLSCDGKSGAPDTCPAGWGCGSDGICRQALGEFEPGPTIPGGAIRALTGDFDGDKLADLLVVGETKITVAYFDATGAISATNEVQSTPGLPAVGDLTTDGIADFVALREGVSVYRGRSNRSLLPVAYSPFALPNDVLEVVVADALPWVPGVNEFAGSELMFVVGDQLIGGDGFQIVQLPVTSENIAGSIVSGDVQELGSPCEELVVAPAGENWVWLYTPCQAQGASYEWNSNGAGTAVQQLPSVQLGPNTRISQGVVLGHVNGDDHLDMVIGAEPQNPDACFGTEDAAELWVTYGVGDGSFHSDPDTIPPLGGDGRALRIDPGLFCTMPLAIGDLNGDGAGDFVTPELILMSFSDASAPGPFGVNYFPAQFNFDAPWTEALVADFNGNGWNDVVAISEDESALRFFNGTGTEALNAFTLSTAGPPAELVAGDFDGDLVADIAFRTLGAHGEAAPGTELGDSLAIAFGNLSGAPSSPVNMGRLARIQQVETGQFQSFGAVEAVSDLVVISQSEDQTSESVAVLIGSGDRQLLSPFFLQQDGDDVLPLRTALGQFDGDESGHTDIVVLSNPAFDTTTGEIVPGGDGGTNGRLFLMPSTGEAQIDASTVTSGQEFPAAFVSQQSLLAPIDLNSDGVDEVVVIGPYRADQAKRGALVIARVAEQNGQLGFALDEPIPVDEGYLFEDFGEVFDEDQPVPVGGDPTAPNTPDLGLRDEYYNAQVAVKDVTGDGLPDLIALGRGTDGDGVPWTRLVIFPNRGDGSLDVDGRVFISGPEGANLTSFALVQSDDDDEVEMIALTSFTAYLADLDVAASQLTDVVDLEVRGGERVVAADFTGDGVDDMAIVEEDVTTVYLGQPVNR